MAKVKARWVDCPGEAMGAGDFIRRVVPYDVPTVHRVDRVDGDHVEAHPVKADGSRDWRWAGGWSGSVAGYVKVRRL